MKIQDLMKILSAFDEKLEVVIHDADTGDFLNITEISVHAHFISIAGQYGNEFSPQETKLYLDENR